MVTVKMFI